MAISLGLAIREGNRMWEDDQFRRQQRARALRMQEQADEDRARRMRQEDFTFSRLQLQAEREDAEFTRKESKRMRIENNLQIISEYEGDIQRGSTSAFVELMNRLDNTGSTYELDMSDKDGFKNGLKLIRTNPDGTRDNYTEKTQNAQTAVSTLRNYVRTTAENVAYAGAQADAATQMRRDIEVEKAKNKAELQKLAFKSRPTDQDRVKMANLIAANSLPNVTVDKNGNFVGIEGAPLTPNDLVAANNIANKALQSYNDTLAAGGGMDFGAAFVAAENVGRKAAAGAQAAQGLPGIVETAQTPTLARPDEATAVGPRQREYVVGGPAFGISRDLPVYRDTPAPTRTAPTRKYNEEELRAIPESAWGDKVSDLYDAINKASIANTGAPTPATPEQIREGFLASDLNKRAAVLQSAGVPVAPATQGIRRDSSVMDEAPRLGLQ